MTIVKKCALLGMVLFLSSAPQLLATPNSSQAVNQVSDNIDEFQFLSRNASMSDVIAVNDTLSLVAWAETIDHERKHYFHIKVAQYSTQTGWSKPYTLNDTRLTRWASDPKFYYNSNDNTVYLHWKQVYKNDPNCHSEVCFRTHRKKYLNRPDRPFESNWTHSTVFEDNTSLTADHPKVAFGSNTGKTIQIVSRKPGEQQIVAFDYLDRQHDYGETLLSTSDQLNELHFTALNAKTYLVVFTRVEPLLGADNKENNRKMVKMYSMLYSPGSTRSDPQLILTSIDDTFQNHHALKVRDLQADKNGNAVLEFSAYEKFATADGEKQAWRDRLYIRTFNRSRGWNRPQRIDPYASDMQEPMGVITLMQQSLAHTFFNGYCPADEEDTEAHTFVDYCVYHFRSDEDQARVLYRSTDKVFYYLSDAVVSGNGRRVGLFLYAMHVSDDNEFVSKFFTGRLSAAGVYDLRSEALVGGLELEDDEYTLSHETKRNIAIANNDKILVSFDTTLFLKEENRNLDVVLAGQHAGRCDVARCVSDYFVTEEEQSVEEGEQGARWTNPKNPNDVDDDGQVTPLDAIKVINAINNRKFGATGELPAEKSSDDPFYDVNADGFVTAQDALTLFNILNG